MNRVKSIKFFLITAFVLVFVVAVAANFLSPSQPQKYIPKTVVSYTLAQVEAHSNSGSCWTIVQYSIYDLTPWINQHPGGSEAILSICGKDGTAAFENQHGGKSKPATELKAFYIGTYKK